MFIILRHFQINKGVTKKPELSPADLNRFNKVLRSY